MLIRSNEINETKVILPGGEWWNNLKLMLKLAGLTPELKGKSLVGTIPELSLLFVLARPMDVPLWLTQPNSKAIFGVTGSDCLKEWQLATADKPDGEKTLQEKILKQPSAVLPYAQQPTIALYATPNSQAKSEKKWLEDGGTVVTTFPNITSYFLGGKNNVRIVGVGGKTEGLWAIDDSITGVADVRSSGRTAEENGLRVLSTIMEVSLVGLLAESVCPVANKRIADLIEILDKLPVETDSVAVNQYSSLINRDNFRNAVARR